jgi:hypothetical protein
LAGGCSPEVLIVDVSVCVVVPSDVETAVVFLTSAFLSQPVAAPTRHNVMQIAIKRFMPKLLRYGKTALVRLPGQISPAKETIHLDQVYSPLRSIIRDLRSKVVITARPAIDLIETQPFTWFHMNHVAN